MGLLATYSYLNSAFLEVFHYYEVEEPGWLVWLGFVLITSVVWEGNRWMEPKLSALTLSLHPLLRQFLASLILSAVTGWLVTQGLNRVYHGQWLPITDIHLKLSITFALRVNLFLQCINAFLYFVRQSKEKASEAEHLKTVVAQSELQQLRNQINPHFLFNNLNVLSALVMKNQQEANSFIESFATVYRHILEAKDQDLTPLEEELNMLKPYQFLLEKRFGEALVIQFRIPEESHQCYIVPASIQLLIENAIKHNALSVHQPLHITISADPSGQELSVSNKRQSKYKTEKSTGTGLQNIAERYKYATGKSIRVIDAEGVFEVRIPLVKN